MQDWILSTHFFLLLHGLASSHHELLLLWICLMQTSRVNDPYNGDFWWVKKDHVTWTWTLDPDGSRLNLPKWHPSSGESWWLPTWEATARDTTWVNWWSCEYPLGENFNVSSSRNGWHIFCFRYLLMIKLPQSTVKERNIFSAYILVLKFPFLLNHDRKWWHKDVRYVSRYQNRQKILQNN